MKEGVEPSEATFGAVLAARSSSQLLKVSGELFELMKEVYRIELSVEPEHFTHGFGSRAPSNFAYRILVSVVERMCRLPMAGDAKWRLNLGGRC